MCDKWLQTETMKPAASCLPGSLQPKPEDQMKQDLTNIWPTLMLLEDQTIRRTSPLKPAMSMTPNFQALISMFMGILFSQFAFGCFLITQDLFIPSNIWLIFFALYHGLQLCVSVFNA